MTDTDSTPDDSRTASLVEMFTAFTPITEYPLPNHDEIDSFVANQPELDEEDEITVDTLHLDYVNRIARNGEWIVFTIELYGYGGSVYAWNRELGEGLRIPTDEWQFGSFAEVISLARSADSSWNSDEEPATPPTDGCPYCDEASSDDMTSSTRPSGSIKQRCTNCGRSKLVG